MSDELSSGEKYFIKVGMAQDNPINPPAKKKPNRHIQEAFSEGLGIN